MGMFEKRRAKKFFMFVQEWEADNPKTHQGLNLDTLPTTEVFKFFLA
jgi:Rab GDP dissociation inhibitor